MAVRIGRIRAGGLSIRGRPTASREAGRRSGPGTRLARFVLDLASEPDRRAASPRIRRGQGRSRGRDRREVLQARTSTIPRRRVKSPWRVSSRGWRFCQTIWGIKRSSCRRGQDVKRGWACGSIPASFVAAMATWSRTSGESSPARATPVPDRGIDPCPISRGPDAPGPERRDRCSDSRRAWNSGSSRPAPTQGPQGVHPARASRPGRRGRVPRAVVGSLAPPAR